MKKWSSIVSMLTLLFIFLGFGSCGDDSSFSRYSYDDPTIYSPSDKTIFSEVILFLSPYIEHEGERKYVITDKLEGLSLKINNRSWELSDSYMLDTLHLDSKETFGEYRVTSQKINYPFVMNVRIDYGTLETAGQYADMLNNYLSLTPGNYVCQIISFGMKSIAGSQKTVYTPSLSFPLEVKENQSSANLGEFEILVR